MIQLNVSDVRPFLPSRDFAVSKDFYLALGWEIKWSDDKLALMENGGHRFYLQAYYAKEWADNSMLHVSVADVASSYAQLSEVLATGRFPGASVSAPRAEPYGALVSYACDPAGVLLHLAQWT